MKRQVAIVAFGMLGAAMLARAGDREDVMAVIDKYVETEEAGRMIEQGRLMTDDRSMVYVGGRLTGDNRKSMREQQQSEDEHQKRFPGVHYSIEIKDVRMQLYNGDTALVTMDWYPTRVVPASLPPARAKELEPAKTPLIVALLLVKQAGEWKIAFSTFVPREE